MAGFINNIHDKATGNEYFRQVLFTTPKSQLVVMSLAPNEDIGMEIHGSSDQFIRIESGEGKAIIAEEEYDLGAGDAIVIPSGIEHNLINVSEEEDLKLYSIYSPPHHPEGTIHKTKADAEAEEE